MIVVKIMGGLGNQMFQYAAARALAVRRHTSLELDITSYQSMADGDTPREYELDVYKINANIASSRTLGLIQESDSSRSLGERIRGMVGLGKIWTYREKSSSYDREMSNLNSAYLVGWWQSEEYFKDIRSIILKELEPVAEPSSYNAGLLEQIGSCEAVSIHVRRGDYVSNKSASVFHGLTPLEYYSESIKYIQSHTKNSRFFVFSDDIKWCKSDLPLPADSIFVEGNNGKQAYEDIRLMKNCKHNIIANSSFSWWGAWLNQHPEKIVIAPKIWFQDTEANSATNIVPDGWIRL